MHVAHLLFSDGTVYRACQKVLAYAQWGFTQPQPQPFWQALSLSFAASIWAELEVALDDAAGGVGEEVGEIGIGAK